MKVKNEIFKLVLITEVLSFFMGICVIFARSFALCMIFGVIYGITMGKITHHFIEKISSMV